MDPERFIACNVWQKRCSHENREAIGDVHEYLPVYVMDPERFKATRNRVLFDEAQAMREHRANWRNALRGERRHQLADDRTENFLHLLKRDGEMNECGDLRRVDHKN